MNMDPTMKLSTQSFDMARLGAALRSGQVTPMDVVDEVLRRVGNDDHHAWTSVHDRDTLQEMAQGLMAQGPEGKPLYGLPFAIKDNIDLAGLPTTAACPEFAFVPERSAWVVQRLIDAGALPIGKTNMDQFATGLNGTRSPYGACRNALVPERVSGGSSSGSAVSLALGQVSFALGTDTAGSGRVPAAFNQLVGFKPTCGLLSTSGVVPACRSLDTVSIFAFTAEDAHDVFRVALGEDASDPFARAAQPHGFDLGRVPQGDAVPRLGVPLPSQREFFGDAAWQSAFERAIERARDLGLQVVDIDISALLQTAQLLYDGPWVAERYQAIRAFIDARPEAVFPVTREITLKGRVPSAADAFEAQYRLKALQRQAAALWREVDVIMLPTTPCHPTTADMLADPVALNSRLGWYTNHMNLLDWSAVAVPADWTETGPFGVTLMAPAHQDVPLLHLAARWQSALDGRAAWLGATGHVAPQARDVPPATASGMVQVAVCGAHLEGQPLNWQLTQRGARRVACTHTSPNHRLVALDPAGAPVLRPGLIRVAPGTPGSGPIEVEVWEMPSAHFGSFVAGIPAPLGIGKTVLADGRVVPGFICEPEGLQGAIDITAFGGWRAWLASRQP